MVFNKIKNIYVNKKFEQEMSNGVISYNLIEDIYFSKKNAKTFFYGNFILLSLFFYSILLIAFSASGIFLHNLYITIASIIINVISIIVLFFILFFPSIRKTKIKNNVRPIMFFFICLLYCSLKWHIIFKKNDNDKIVNDKIDVLTDQLSDFMEAKKIIFIDDNNLDIKKKDKMFKKTTSLTRHEIISRLKYSAFCIILSSSMVSIVTTILGIVRVSTRSHIDWWS